MQKGANLRVIIDTNLLISAIIASKGNPYEVLESWREDGYTLVTSKELLDEIRSVSQRDYLVKNYPLFAKNAIELIENLSLAAEIITPLQDIDLPIHCRDPKDDKLLSCALGGKADYLITGDKDLLDLDGDPTLGKVKIITAKQFLGPI